MLSRRRPNCRICPAARAAAAVLLAGCSATARCQDAVPEAPVPAVQDVDGGGKIGRLHDRIRRAQRRESLHREMADAYTAYLAWKTRAQNETDVQFSMDVSLLEQWGFARGGSPALQIYAAPSVDWTVFRSGQWGTGSVQVAYDAIARYPTTQNASDIQSRLGLVTPINDYPARTLTFAQLTYTQATPDSGWLVTAGQYPLANFDGNAYLGNQQQNFNNDLFSQNATQTYPNAGLGAFVQFNATGTLQLAAGFQGANNLPGQTLSVSNFRRDCCAWFGYAQWTPRLHGLGSAQYSLAYFDTPAVPAQAASRGWSANAVQNLNDAWALFARANGASGHVAPIRSAYAVGAALNDPLRRASTDQIALAVGLSDPASPPTHPAGARNERALEAYWTWTVYGGLLLTPSLQVVVHPALDPSKHSAGVLSLRATFVF